MLILETMRSVAKNGLVGCGILRGLVSGSFPGSTLQKLTKGAVCAVTVVECLCFLFKGWLKFVESIVFIFLDLDHSCAWGGSSWVRTVFTRPGKGDCCPCMLTLTPALLSRWLGEVAPGWGPPRAVFEGEPCHDKRLHPSAGEEWAEDEWSQKLPEQHP